MAKRQGNYGSRRLKVSTESKLLSQVFTMAQDDGIYVKDIAVNDPNTITKWRLGEHYPSLLKAEQIAANLGYEIIVQRKTAS